MRKTASFDSFFADHDRTWLAVGLSVVASTAVWLAVRRAILNLPTGLLVEDRQARRRTWLQNAVGISLIVVGVALLFLPGPGLLLIFLGIAMCDFPGRDKLLRRLLSRPRVIEDVNAFRQRHGKPPLSNPIRTQDPGAAGGIRSKPPAP